MSFFLYSCHSSYSAPYSRFNCFASFTHRACFMKYTPGGTEKPLLFNEREMLSADQTHEAEVRCIPELRLLESSSVEQTFDKMLVLPGAIQLLRELWVLSRLAAHRLHSLVFLRSSHKNDRLWSQGTAPHSFKIIRSPFLFLLRLTWCRLFRELYSLLINE